MRLGPFWLGLLLALLAACRPQPVLLRPEAETLPLEPGTAAQVRILLRGGKGLRLEVEGPAGLLARGWGDPSRLGYALEATAPGEVLLTLWAGEGLGPGTYPLRLRASLGGRGAEASLRVVVQPPVLRPLEEWRPARPSLLGVAFAAGFFLALGEGGTLLTSPHGEGWTPRATGVRVRLFDAAHGRGRFVAVGQDGTILVSPNLRAWEGLPPPTLEWLYGVAFGRERFVAVGSGPILASEDGKAWRPVARPEGFLGDVAWGPGGFVAVGMGGSLLHSPEGLAWSPLASGTQAHLRGVVHGREGYVAVGDGGTVLHSPDGKGWTRVASLGPDLVAVAHGEGEYVALGARGEVFRSPEGRSWSPWGPPCLPPSPAWPTATASTWPWASGG